MKIFARALPIDVVWMVVLTSILYILSYGPTLHNFSAVAPDRMYWGAEEYPIDLLGNLSTMQQGKAGFLTAYPNYSTHISIVRSIVKFEYIALGHLARIFHMDIVTMFFIGRAVLSVLYIVIIGWIVRAIFTVPWQRIVAFGIILFGSYISYPLVTTFDFGYLPKELPYDALIFNRLVQAMPHYLLGGALSLVSMYYFSVVLKQPSERRSFCVSVVTGMVSALLYGPNMVLFVSTFPVFAVLLCIAYRGKRTGISWVISRGGIFVSYAIYIAIPLFGVRYWQAVVGSATRTTTRMEMLNPFNLTGVLYLFSVGVPYVLAIIGLPRIIRTKQPFLLLLAAWIIMHPVGEYVVSPLIQINYVRYFLTPYFVVFGILSVYGIVTLSEYVHRITQTATWIGIVFLLIILLGSGAYSYHANIFRNALCFCMGPSFDFSYPKKSLMNGVFWLRDHTKQSDIVLSGIYESTLISAFAGNKVYTSWWHRLVESPEFYDVNDQKNDFFRHRMNAITARNFLQKNAISYILYYGDPQEEYLGFSTYEFLQKVYSSQKVQIFRPIL